jgi:hypothetical protein
MAHIIDPLTLERAKPGAQPLYPWGEWTDGLWREAVLGEDFTVPPKSFRSCLYHHARTHGLTVHTRLTKDGVAFCFESGTPMSDEQIAHIWGREQED